MGVEGDKPRTIQYRIVFKQPVPFGSLFAGGELQTGKYLKPTAKAPGDPAKAADWVELAISPRQSGGQLIVPEKPVETRAILVTDVRTNNAGRLKSLRLFAARPWNVTPYALAYADREYNPPNSDFFYAANLVTSATGAWQSSGKDNNGR